MMPIPLYRYQTLTHEGACAMRDICNDEWEKLTGKHNVLTRHTKNGKTRVIPVVCVSTSGLNGWWSLECNDPEIDKTLLYKLVTAICVHEPKVQNCSSELSPGGHA